MWSEKQRRRLGAEKRLLDQKMPQFKFYSPLIDTYVAGKAKTSDGRKYKLKLILGKRFPDEMPKLYVVSPRLLPKYGDGTINSEGVSHSFHTQENGPDGCVQICHYSSSLWDPSKSIFGIMLKALIWAEGYCQHLRTGKSIATFCDEIKPFIIQVSGFPRAS